MVADVVSDRYFFARLFTTICQPLRGWSYESAEKVLPGSPGTGRSHGSGAPERTPFAVGGDQVHFQQDWLHARDMTPVGAAS